MTGHRILYDISVDLSTEAFAFPGDPPFKREMVLTLEESGACNVSKLEMSAHSGTHIDMPAHFIAGGNTLDAAAIDDFILPARVVEINDPESVKAAALDGIDVNPGDALLFKTVNSLSGRSKSGAFSENFVHISMAAATACVEKGVCMVGLDYITIDRYGDEAAPAHRELLGRGIPVLEGISLEATPPGRYTLICLPLKIRGCEASPVRAVLVENSLEM
jgi:arylformamidase